MTVDQVLADLRMLPGDALVVFESVRVFAPVVGVSPRRVHVVGAGVEPHFATDCGGCGRSELLVGAVSLLGRDSGGGR